MSKDDNINCTIEALILASPEPVPVRKICDVMDEVNPSRVREAIADLNNVYMGCGSSFRIREVAGGYQFYILPDFEQPVKKLLTREKTIRLTRAALESLAIIAYKQPVTKVELEHIRGVASDGVLNNLLQHKLIAIAGRANAPGRPLLYKTTSEFLKFFGLNRLSDLPRMDEIEEMIREETQSMDQIALPFTETSSVINPEKLAELEAARTGEPSNGNGNGNGSGNGDSETDHQLVNMITVDRQLFDVSSSDDDFDDDFERDENSDDDFERCVDDEVFEAECEFDGEDIVDDNEAMVVSGIPAAHPEDSSRFRSEVVDLLPPAVQAATTLDEDDLDNGFEDEFDDEEDDEDDTFIDLEAEDTEAPVGEEGDTSSERE